MLSRRGSAAAIGVHGSPTPRRERPTVKRTLPAMLRRIAADWIGNPTPLPDGFTYRGTVLEPTMA